MHKQYDVLVVGDLNVDLNLIGEDITPAFEQQEKLVDDAALVVGGSSGIFACQAAKLGLRVAFAGAVGDDAFGHFLTGALTGAGIDTQYVRVDPAVKTGLTVHLVRGNDRAMLTYLGTLGTFDAAHVTADILARTRHVHSGSYFVLPRLRPRLPALFAEARRLGASTSLDTNFDPTGQWDGGIGELLPQVDVFLPNAHELQSIAGVTGIDAAMEALAGRGVGTVAVKLGDAGATARAGAKTVQCAPFPVKVVDTTGAGDSFDAGFIYGYLHGWPLSDALRLGCACGALCATALGGVPGQPALAQACELAGLRVNRE
ncbi:MAG: sugar kinase [Anaerolineae bacterium]|nr:sugar kinase [Anaerolineae bacterium]